MQIFPEVVVQRASKLAALNSSVSARSGRNIPARLPSGNAAKAHVEQLFDYPSAARKIMYTTNAIEAVNSSFRKVTKRGAFPNDNSVFKLLYLRVVELQKKVGRPPHCQLVART